VKLSGIMHSKLVDYVDREYMSDMELLLIAVTG